MIEESQNLENKFEVISNMYNSNAQDLTLIYFAERDELRSFYFLRVLATRLPLDLLRATWQLGMGL